MSKEVEELLNKSEIECCKEELKNYIEFMETAGDNAGWARGLKWYVEELEKEKQQVLDDYQELGKDLASNFIAKEVIREKLEELKENLNTVEHYETVGAIRILKEILEGEKK